MTEEHKRKIGLWHKGKIITAEQRKRISETLKKNPVRYWLGKKRPPCSDEHKRKTSEALTGIKRSLSTRLKMGLSKKGNKYCLGRKFSEESKRKIGLASSIALSEKKRPLEVCRKISMSKKGKYMGPMASGWKGGVRPKNLLIRDSWQYKEWRTNVFERDNYTCIFCGQIGGVLNADHIKTFAHHPELRFDINNGRTLCVPCHRKTDNFGNKARNEVKKIYGI